MSKIKEIFEKQNINMELMNEIEKMAEPTTKYVIAMTPRSGSSHLCDVMKNTNLFGNPGEFLPTEFIPKILLRAPAKNADDYLMNVLKVLQSANGVSGLKTSWFQFQNFSNELRNRSILHQYKYIYLTRRDLSAQAVSLYKATESKVFHTNIGHSEEALAKLGQLEYNYKVIKDWHSHIVAQETGWKKFFGTSNIFPLSITYEDIDEDVSAVVARIASYLKVNLPKDVACAKLSIFQKIGNRKNVEWANQFALEHDLELRQAIG